MALIYTQSIDGQNEQNDYTQVLASVFETGYAFYTITKVTLYLKKNGSPSGTVTCELFQGTDLPQSPTETSSTSYNVNDLTTSYVGYDFTFAGTTTLTSADFKITATFSAMNASNYGRVSMSLNELSNRRSERSTGANAWESMRVQCFKMLVYGSGSPPSSSGGRLPPPPIVLGGL